MAFCAQIIDKFNDLPSLFGSPFPENGLHGAAVGSVPSDGCSNIKPPNSMKTKWIVVISR